MDRVGQLLGVSGWAPRAVRGRGASSTPTRQPPPTTDNNHLMTGAGKGARVGEEGCNMEGRVTPKGSYNRTNVTDTG